jgi:hypothetical protein
LLIVKLEKVKDVPNTQQKEMDILLHKCYDLLNHCMEHQVSSDPMMIGAAFMTAARQIYIDTVGPKQTQDLFQVFTDQVVGEYKQTIH